MRDGLAVTIFPDVQGVADLATTVATGSRFIWRLSSQPRTPHKRPGFPGAQRGTLHLYGGASGPSKSGPSVCLHLQLFLGAHYSA